MCILFHVIHNVEECDFFILLNMIGLSQDMIENVLEIKDTHVREVMTPLVDVVAIDAGATLVDFHKQWVDHHYSRCESLFLSVRYAVVGL